MAEKQAGGLWFLAPISQATGRARPPAAPATPAQPTGPAPPAAGRPTQPAAGAQGVKPKEDDQAIMESLRAQEEAEAGTPDCPTLAERPGLYLPLHA